MLTLTGIREALQSAVAIKTELEARAAALTKELETLHADRTRTDEHKRERERTLRDQVQQAAGKLLQERAALERLETVLRDEVHYSRGAVCRRQPLTQSKDETAEQLARVSLLLELQHAGHDELSERFDEAEAAGRLAQAQAVVREVRHRAAAGGTVETTQARELTQRFGQLAVPEADEAAGLFAQLRQSRSQIHATFTSLGRALTPTEKLNAARGGLVRSAIGAPAVEGTPFERMKRAHEGEPQAEDGAA